jgi:hypothetical protein
MKTAPKLQEHLKSLNRLNIVIYCYCGRLFYCILNVKTEKMCEKLHIRAIFTHFLYFHVQTPKIQKKPSILDAKTKTFGPKSGKNTVLTLWPPQCQIGWVSTSHLTFFQHRLPLWTHYFLIE